MRRRLVARDVFVIAVVLGRIGQGLQVARHVRAQTFAAHVLQVVRGFVPLSQASRWMEKRPVKGYVEGAPDPLADAPGA